MSKKLPGIPSYRTEDRALAATLGALTEHAEVRSGSRGDPQDRAATQADIAALQRQIDALMAPAQKRNGNDIRIDLGGGATGTIPMDVLVDGLLANQKFNNAIEPTAADSGTVTGATVGDINRVEASLRAAIDELQARAAGSDALAASAFELRGGKVALKPNVYLVNTLETGAVMEDIYQRLYQGTIATKVQLTPDSVLYKGFTVQALFDYIDAQLGSLQGQVSTKPTVSGTSGGNPGTGFTHTISLSQNGITVRVPVFYP